MNKVGQCSECDRVGTLWVGRCATHYGRYVKERRLASGETCYIKGCTRPRHTLQFCGMHYQRMCKTGSVGPTESLKRSWGEGTDWDLDSKGYISRQISLPKRDGKYQRQRIYLHREMMENSLGRELRPDEEVHHKNGDKTDNRIENLEIRLVSRHPKGQTIREKYEYAVWILDNYAA